MQGQVQVWGRRGPPTTERVDTQAEVIRAVVAALESPAALEVAAWGTDGGYHLWHARRATVGEAWRWCKGSDPRGVEAAG